MGVKEKSIEKWIQVKGFEGLYWLSNFGDVRNKRGKTLSQSQFGEKNGYLRVRFFVNKKKYCFLVHRLMMEAFVPNTLNLPCVNHKDEIKTHNFIYVNPDGSVDLEKSNLEWCSVEYNDNYGSRNKKISESKKKKHPKAQKIKMISLDGKVLDIFNSANQAADFLHKSDSNIISCANHKPHYNTAYGYKWEWD